MKIKRLVAAGILISLVVSGVTMMAPLPVQAASLPRYSVQYKATGGNFVTNETAKIKKSRQFSADLIELLATYPEIPSIDVSHVIFEDTSQVDSDCGVAVLGCYDNGTIYYRDNADDTTIIHELLHASLLGSWTLPSEGTHDIVQEGIVETLALHATSDTSGSGYPEEVSITAKLIDLMGKIALAQSGKTGDAHQVGFAELRRVAFTEGEEAGINRRLGPYSTYANPFATLNFYGKAIESDRQANGYRYNDLGYSKLGSQGQAAYAFLNHWLDQLSAKVDATRSACTQSSSSGQTASGGDQTGGQAGCQSGAPAQSSNDYYTFTQTNYKTLINSQNPKLADVYIFYGVNTPSNGKYKISIEQVDLNHEKTYSPIETDWVTFGKEGNGQYHYQEDVPYKAEVSVSILVPGNVATGGSDYSQPAIVRDTKTFTIEINPGDKPNASYPLNFDSSKTTVTLAGGQNIVRYELNRDATSTERASSKVVVADATNGSVVATKGLAIRTDELPVPSLSGSATPSPDDTPTTSWLTVPIARAQGYPGMVSSTASDAKNSYTISIVSNGQNVASRTLGVAAAAGGSNNATPAPVGNTTPTPTVQASSATGATFNNTLFGSGITSVQYFQRLYLWAVGLAFTAATLSIIYAGYLYTMSRGDTTAVNQAKEIIISSLTGVTLLVLSFTILRYLGINIS